MSIFLGGSSAGYTPVPLAGSSGQGHASAQPHPDATSTSSSAITSSSSSFLVGPWDAQWVDDEQAVSPLPGRHDDVLWSGWQVLSWPADVWACDDGKAGRQPGALAKTLPIAFDEDEGAAPQSLAARQPRVGPAAGGGCHP